MSPITPTMLPTIKSKKGETILLFLSIKFLIIVVMLVNFDYLTLAQENTPNVTPVPTEAIDSFPFPNGLFCSKIETGLGSTWEGITTGESTRDQLNAKMMELSSNYIIKDHGQGEVVFSLFLVNEAAKKHIPSGLVACIQNGLVVALRVDAGDPPFTLFDDRIAELGIPDAVTWGNSTNSRVVFWFEKGIAATVSTLEPLRVIVSQVYFPYQTAEGYKDRWPFKYTRTSALPSHEGGTQTPSIQNPFDFEAIIATITAQPSYTPTSILTPAAALTS